MVQGGHERCLQDVKGCHMLMELNLLCGLPRALGTSVPQGHMVERGISMIFLPICRHGFSPGRVHLVGSYGRLVQGRSTESSSISADGEGEDQEIGWVRGLRK